MLIVISGPDRVGKSTLISKLDSVLDNCTIKHHGEPSRNQKTIFQRYKDEIVEWQNSTIEHCIFDRAWPCTYILEQYRNNNLGHMEELIDLELWVNDHVAGGVVHVGQFRPWFWSAPLHVEELLQDSETSKASDWFVRDQYISRMQEHKVYTEQLINFYEDVTMFPNVQLTDSQTPENVLLMCEDALLRSGQ